MNVCSSVHWEGVHGVGKFMLGVTIFLIGQSNLPIKNDQKSYV